jgi:lysophospholipase L1-like esterase
VLPRPARAALLASAALLAFSVPASGSDTRPPGPILLEGDSLALGVAPYLRHNLPGNRIVVHARVGRPLRAGLAELSALRQRLPRVIAVSLGTNDDPSAVESFSSGVEQVLRLAGAERCVVWSNIVRPRVGGVDYGGYNRALALLASGHENLVVVDWASLARRNPSWFGLDGVHPSAAGYQARARAFARGLERCG